MDTKPGKVGTAQPVSVPAARKFVIRAVSICVVLAWGTPENKAIGGEGGIHRIIRGTMGISEDVREAILRLLQVCKRYQVRALSLNHALAKIIETPSNKRSDLTTDQIEAWTREGRRDAEILTNQVAAKLEEALANNKDVLEWLNTYPSMVVTSAIDAVLVRNEERR